MGGGGGGGARGRGGGDRSKVDRRQKTQIRRREDLSRGFFVEVYSTKVPSRSLIDSSVYRYVLGTTVYYSLFSLLLILQPTTYKSVTQRMKTSPIFQSPFLLVVLLASSTIRYVRYSSEFLRRRARAQILSREAGRPTSGRSVCQIRGMRSGRMDTE